MNIRVAHHAGFCFGVRNAVDQARSAAAEYGTVYMLGDIVHNESVVRELADAGVKVVESLDDVGDGPVLFRAHGTPVDLWNEARSRGIQVIDATCPLVHRIHREVRELAEEGRKIFIIGDKGHDEVVGIESQVQDAIVLSDPEETRELRKWKRGGVVSQSTQTIGMFREIVGILLEKVQDLRVMNTICQPTREHQDELRELAETNDVMIIIGSFTSANTKRMAGIASELNPRTYQVEHAEQLDRKWFREGDRVGVHAGASTPDRLIQSVVEKLRSFSTKTQSMEV